MDPTSLSSALSTSTTASPQASPRIKNSATEMTEGLYNTLVKQAAAPCGEAKTARTSVRGFSIPLSARAVDECRIPADAPIARLFTLLNTISDALNFPDMIAFEKLAGAKNILKYLCAQFYSDNADKMSRLAYLTAYEIIEELEQNQRGSEKLQFLTQKHLSQLLKLCWADESLQLPICEVITTLLTNDAGIDGFTNNEFKLLKEDPSYELPAKPHKEPARTNYEIFLQKMASLCLVEGSMKKSSAPSSSGVYEIQFGDKPLFIFKPCDEEFEDLRNEEDRIRFPKGEGALREYLCSRDIAKCCIATLQDKKGFLIEYYPNIVGSVQDFFMTLPRLPDVQEKLEKARRDLGITAGARKDYMLEIWNLPERKKMQKMILESLWNPDVDQNCGNFLIRALDTGDGYGFKELINIDHGRALPNTITNDILFFWTPGWIESKAAKEPLDKALLKHYLEKDPLNEIEECRKIKQALPNMSNQALVWIVLTRWYIQIGLEDGRTLQEITTGQIENKIYDFMNQMEQLTLDKMCNRTFISFKGKCQRYFREPKSPPPLRAAAQAAASAITMPPNNGWEMESEG